MNFVSTERRRRYSTDLRGGSREASQSMSPRARSPSSRPPSSRASSSRASTPRPLAHSLLRRDSIDTPPPLRQPSPAVLECLPTLHDTSLRGTTTNPKVRDWSPSKRRKSVSTFPIDFSTPEAKAALHRLSVQFYPVVLRSVLRERRLRSWAGSYPPREYTVESVVSAISSSSSVFSRWPMDVLHAVASQAVFDFKRASEPLVYYRESYISSGIVVLLYGEVQEQRRASGKVIALNERPIHANRVRTHRAPTTLCDVAVLSEDCCTTSFVAMGPVDVAVIPSRWFWEVLYQYLAASPGTCEPILECFQQIVLPYRNDMLLTTYYPTAVVLQRSWMWSFLSLSDRVKLARTMEVKTLSVGEVVCEEGVYNPYIHILRRGSLTVLVKGVPLGVILPGMSFGEVSVIMGDPRNCTIVTNTISEFYCLHAEELLHRLNKYPEAADPLVGKAVELRRHWMERGKQRDIFGLSILLQGVPCLSHTTDAIRNQIAEKSKVFSFPSKSVIAYKGSSCGALYVIGRGTVRLNAAGPEWRAGGAAVHSGGRKTAKDRPPSVPQPVDAEDLRSGGDYFGEYCLAPHQWWQGVVAETTVDLWVIEKEDLRIVLTRHAALAQAHEICRQGLVLHQARHGGTMSEDASLVLGRDGDASLRSLPSVKNSKGKPPTGRSNSRSPSRPDNASITTASPSPPPTSGGTADSGAMLVLEPPAAVNWVSYALEQSASMLDRLENEDDLKNLQSKNALQHLAPRRMRELHPADKNNEEALQEKVRSLISAAAPTAPREPHPADCDIPPEMEELQAVIVEQLFLTPTDQQAPFLKQVNDSNVKLVTDDDAGGGHMQAADTDAALLLSSAAGVTGGMHQLISETVNNLVEVDRLQSAMPLEALMDEDSSVSGAAACGALDDQDHQNAVGSTTPPNLIPEDILSVDSSAFSPVTWSQLQTPAQFGHNNPAARGAGEEGGAVLSQTLRSSFSKSYFQRPISAGFPAGSTGVSPRFAGLEDAGGVGVGAMVPPLRAMSADWSALSGGALPSAAPPPPGRIRPVSVDLRYQAKTLKPLDPVQSSSVLDRFVKVKDEAYLQSFVKVLPMEQQAEVWDQEDAAGNAAATGEEETQDPNEPDGVSKSRSETPPRPSTGAVSPVSHLGNNILILLHVHQCQYLESDLMKECKEPIVKVSIKNSVRLRTPPMSHSTNPQWEIKESSFITFVNRTQHIDFEVCDSRAERSRRVYRCSLPVSEFEDHNGVGQRTMRLFPVRGGGKEKSSGKSSQRPPRLTITMVAILSSQYKSLQNHLLSSSAGIVATGTTTATMVNNNGVVVVGSGGEPLLDDLDRDPTCCDSDANYVMFQVLGVKNLKHRVEAMIVVTLEHEGKIIHVLETPRVLPKTKNPCWPGAVAHGAVQSDGILCFDVFHKESIISSVRIAVDSLAFGGLGPRCFPLLLANSKNDVIGEMELNVLKTSIYSERAEMDRRREEQVLFLHVEHCQLLGDYAMEPDLLVVVKNENGDLVLTTPLVINTLEASWPRDVASCFIPCPYLTGSSCKYVMEVYDSTIDTASRIGGATVLVTREGLGMENRYDVQFKGPKGHGMIRLTALCLPVLDLQTFNDKKRHHHNNHLPPRTPVVIGNNANGGGGGSDDVLLLIHVAGCQDLFNITQSYCEVDPLVTVSLRDEEVLRTPIAEGSGSQPTWSISESASAVLLRVRPGEESTAVLRWEVFDGLVDETELLGYAETALHEMCFTGKHQWSLQGRGPPVSHAELSRPSSSAMSTPPPPSAAARPQGMISVETMCGRLGQSIFQHSHLSALASSPLMTHSSTGPLFSLPAVMPAGSNSMSSTIGGLDDERSPSTSLTVPRGSGGMSKPLSPFIRCALTNICQVLPQVERKSIEVSVSNGQGGTLLSSVKRDMTAESETWQWDESVVCIEMGKVAPSQNLEVRVTALAATEDTNKGTGLPNSSSSSTGANSVLVGTAMISAEVLYRVSVGEVALHTAILKPSDPSKAGRQSGPLNDLSRNLGRPPTPGKMSKCKLSGDYLRPNITFCLIGLQEAL